MNCCAQHNYESDPPTSRPRKRQQKCCNVELVNLQYSQKKFDAPSNAKIKARSGSMGKPVSSWCNPANGPGVEGAYAER
jgi:hypothetical protein